MRLPRGKTQTSGCASTFARKRDLSFPPKLLDVVNGLPVIMSASSACRPGIVSCIIRHGRGIKVIGCVPRDPFPVLRSSPIGSCRHQVGHQFRRGLWRRCCAVLDKRMGQKKLSLAFPLGGHIVDFSFLETELCIVGLSLKKYVYLEACSQTFGC